MQAPRRSRHLTRLIAAVMVLAVAALPALAEQAAAARPLTRAEVLAYLRSIPHSQDGSVPYQVRKEAHDELTRLIKQRGVDFLIPAGTFDKELYQAGISSNSSVAIWQNYRAPGAPPPAAAGATLGFFTGRWDIGAAGMTTRYDREGSTVVRRDTMTGAVGGVLEISADRTYLWQHHQSATPIRGRWRAATGPELQTEAGPGVVLLAGYDGVDWLVVRRPADRADEQRITVSHLTQRFRYFIGGRSGDR